MKKIFLALVMLLSLGSTLWIEKVSAKTVNFIIRNSDDWKRFRDEVQNSKGKYWVDARLEADITTGLGIGITADTPYRGTFDGNGHTITFNKDGFTEKFIAPFRHASNATIRNLYVAGTIESGQMYPAGLVAQVKDGTVTIENCISSVTLKGGMNGGPSGDDMKNFGTSSKSNGTSTNIIES